MTYSFDTRDNAYFEGRDLRVTRDDDGRTIIVQRKEDYWGLNVKSEWVRAHRTAEVQTAADNLSEGILSGLEEHATDFFWREADNLRSSHGFAGPVFSEGRSGGWLCLNDTLTLSSNSPMEPTSEEKQRVAQWLNFCFEADELRETAEFHFDDCILETNQNLQVELSEYADWVGAEVQMLDGGLLVVGWLGAAQGRPTFRKAKGASGFCFANETKIVRKANGKVPSRLTADPIMEQVFGIIEARGELSKEEIDAFLDADPNHEPDVLYVSEVVRSVNDIERMIEAWSFKHLKIDHG